MTPLRRLRSGLPCGSRSGPPNRIRLLRRRSRRRSPPRPPLRRNSARNRPQMRTILNHRASSSAGPAISALRDRSRQGGGISDATWFEVHCWPPGAARLVCQRISRCRFLNRSAAGVDHRRLDAATARLSGSGYFPVSPHGSFSENAVRNPLYEWRVIEEQLGSNPGSTRFSVSVTLYFSHHT